MKKGLSIIFALSLLCFSGCGGDTSNDEKSDSDTSNIVDLNTDQLSETSSVLGTAEGVVSQISGKFFVDGEGDTIYTFKSGGTGEISEKGLGGVKIKIEFAKSNDILFISKNSISDCMAYVYTFDGTNLVLTNDAKTLKLIKLDDTDFPPTEENFTKVSGEFYLEGDSNTMYTFNSDGSGKILNKNSPTGVHLSFAQTERTMFISKESISNSNAYIYTFDGNRLYLKDSLENTIVLTR